MDGSVQENNIYFCLTINKNLEIAAGSQENQNIRKTYISRAQSHSYTYARFVHIEQIRLASESATNINETSGLRMNRGRSLHFCSHIFVQACRI